MELLVALSYKGARARTARPTPTLPVAPLTFSIIIGWPSVVRIRSETIRATISAGPPAANGTMMVIDRVG